MLLFLRRYCGWYFWLGLYTSIIGALIGMACFAIFFLLIVLAGIAHLFPWAFAFAAPLNLVMLPIAFHLLCDHPDRKSSLQLVGLIGGFVSPTLGLLVLGIFNREARTMLGNLTSLVAILGIAGSIAGAMCARLWNRRGGDSLFCGPDVAAGF
jgi:hypothetical protein